MREISTGIGFDFPFFDETILSSSSIYFDTNGRLSLSSISSSYSPSQSNMLSNKIIAFLYDDLGSSSYNNEYWCLNQGSSPNKYAVFRVDSTWYSNSGSAQAEIVLYEDGDIIINYGNVEPASGFYYGISAGNDSTAYYNISDSSDYSNKSFKYSLSKDYNKGVIPMNSGSPFYTTTQNPNIDSSCLKSMKDGDSCNIIWDVFSNVSILAENYKFFTFVESIDYPSYISNIKSDNIFINIS